MIGSNSSHVGNYTEVPAGFPMTGPVVTFTASTVGNLLAILVIWRNQNRSDKQSVFYTLVMSLAILDLVSTLITSPLTFVSYGTGKTVLGLGGEILCKYSGLTMTYFGLASMAIVFTMSVERLIAIRFAFFYHTKVNARKTKLAIVIVLLLFLCMSALPLAGFGEIKVQPPGTWCFLNWKATETVHQVFNLTVVAMGVLMMIGTMFCNLYVVARVVKKRSKMKICNSTLQVMSKRRLRKIAMDETQMMVLLGVMTGVFVICYLPLLLRITINQMAAIYNIEDTTSSWNLFAVRMASINPILDPWVYIFCRRATFVGIYKLAKAIISCELSREQFLFVFSTGREYKRRNSTQSMALHSTKQKETKALSADMSSDQSAQQLALKFGRKWRTGATHVHNTVAKTDPATQLLTE